MLLASEMWVFRHKGGWNTPKRPNLCFLVLGWGWGLQLSSCYILLGKIFQNLIYKHMGNRRDFVLSATLLLTERAAAELRMWRKPDSEITRWGLGSSRYDRQTPLNSLNPKKTGWATGKGNRAEDPHGRGSASVGRTHPFRMSYCTCYVQWILRWMSVVQSIRQSVHPHSVDPGACSPPTCLGEVCRLPTTYISHEVGGEGGWGPMRRYLYADSVALCQIKA